MGARSGRKAPKRVVELENSLLYSLFSGKSPWVARVQRHAIVGRESASTRFYGEGGPKGGNAPHRRLSAGALASASSANASFPCMILRTKPLASHTSAARMSTAIAPRI